MAKKSPSAPEGKPDEPIIYRFQNDKLVDPNQNTFVVHQKLTDLFAPKAPPLKIYDEPKK